MNSIISSIRARQGAFFRHIFVFFWFLSISNTILFPAYTISEEDIDPYVAVVQVGKQAPVSFLGLVFELASNTNAMDALLADTQEDGLDKVYFITSRCASLKNPEASLLNLLHTHGVASPDIPPLGINTPPPKG